ncbi:MAG: hypothetical protein LC723_10645, partial [Actinobacteria bacterium]|nr:hypothetical protein [Actinomycetota bacterium]
EWVHYIWNSLVFTSTLLLLWKFRSNTWLWVAFVFAVWHQFEHTYILSVYLQTGMSGSPGLLSKGGLIAGGLPIVRPVLHTLYNVFEMIPLIIGFFVEVRRANVSEPASAVRVLETKPAL